tara:strand:+ start:4567 stop:5460 length:894 start_codon:yes stop_codon:yes gene_type:complete
MTTNWHDPDRYRSGRKGNYDQYDTDVAQAFINADADGDGIISRNEYKKWDSQIFDIIGDGHAPFRGNKWDYGAARQRALLSGLTRNNLSLEDSSVLGQHGIWRDDQTGDLYGATPYKSALFGRNVDDEFSSYVGGYKKEDDKLTATGYDYSDWQDDDVPVYKYAYQGDWTPIEEEVVEEECPAGQIKGVSGACIEDKEYADNPWEEPEKTPAELVKKREDWDANWDPNRYVDDPSDVGSIPYLTPTMSSSDESSSKYKPSILSGKFNRYIGGEQSTDSEKELESLLRATGYRENRFS